MFESYSEKKTTNGVEAIQYYVSKAGKAVAPADFWLAFFARGGTEPWLRVFCQQQFGLNGELTLPKMRGFLNIKDTWYCEKNAFHFYKDNAFGLTYKEGLADSVPIINSHLHSWQILQDYFHDAELVGARTLEPVI